MKYEAVMGLEVHVELATKSKIFCGCTTAFGGEPNTHVCPVCTGMPGTLPVLNKKVVEFAIRAGLALHCQINEYNKFDRKNYFYPDLPKAYQTSQLYMPICQNGFIEIDTDEGSKKIGITEIHMEEDAGKLVHDAALDCTLVDYNRGGVPLIEIVSQPDLRTGSEVIAYLEKLREILIFLGVSDCKMQEGSMRADINISMRPYGAEALGVRTEMKNMNSFKAIYRAIAAETERQIEILESGQAVLQETRRWDDEKNMSFPMRSKENAQDYRYFPEPDLLPLQIPSEWIEEIKNNSPELPSDKRKRYTEEYKLSAYDASILVSCRQTAVLFEQTNALCHHAKETANIIIGEIMRLLNEDGLSPENLNIDPVKLAALIDLITGGKINRPTAKTVLYEIYKNDVEPLRFVEEKGLLMLDDDSLIEKVIDEVLANNPKSIADFKSGKEKAFGSLVGQVMKQLKGKANPRTVNEILKDKLLMN